MDFNSPIYINTASGGTLNINSIAASDLTTSLGPRSGYKVMGVGIGGANAVGYTDKRSVDDGIDYGDVYLSGKTITISCGVFGSTLGDYHSKVQKLVDTMRVSPRYYDASYGFRNLLFSQPTIDTTNYSTGLAPLQMVVRPMAIPEISLNQTASIGTNAKGFSGAVELNFMAAEPYRYRQDSRSIAIDIGSSTAVVASTSLPNIGTVPVQPVLEIQHPSSTTGAVTIDSLTIVMDGKTAKVNNLVFAAKDTNNETRWYIDFDKHAVYRGVRSTAGGAYIQTLRQDVLDTTYFTFGFILPADDGSTTLTLQYSGGVAPTTINCLYREAYY